MIQNTILNYRINFFFLTDIFKFKCMSFFFYLNLTKMLWEHKCISFLRVKLCVNVDMSLVLVTRCHLNHLGVLLSLLSSQSGVISPIVFRCFVKQSPLSNTFEDCPLNALEIQCLPALVGLDERSQYRILLKGPKID